jgi:hypothetical protein
MQTPQRRFVNVLAICTIIAGGASLAHARPAAAATVHLNPPYSCTGPTCSCSGQNYATCSNGGCSCG